MLTAQDHTTMIHAFYDAFNRREMDKVLALVSRDVKWSNLAFNKDYTGHSGYRDFLGNWTTSMPDCKVEVVNVIVGEEWAAVECIGRGTHTGPLVGPQGSIPATQKKVDLKFCEVLKLKDGEIMEGRVYFDSATLLRQLGAQPQTPAVAQPQPASQPQPAGR